MTANATTMATATATAMGTAGLGAVLRSGPAARGGRGPEAAPISALWLVSQRPTARALALDESGCLVPLQAGGGAPRLLRVALPFEPEPTLGRTVAAALHARRLSALRAAAVAPARRR